MLEYWNLPGMTLERGKYYLICVLETGTILDMHIILLTNFADDFVLISVVLKRFYAVQSTSLYLIVFFSFFRKEENEINWKTRLRFIAIIEV